MEKSNLRWWRRPNPLVKYTAAVVLVLIAFFVTVQLRAHFEQTPNSLFFCAVILAAWYGGFGPGLLAGVLSVAAIEGFLRSPDVAFEMDASEVSRSVVFLFATFLISWICSKQKLGAGLLRQARDELEAKVEERTQDLRRVNEELRRSETYLTEGQRLSHTGIWGDRVQLQQVLLNLVANALDAMETISDHPRIVRICSDRNQTETIRVMVKDSGIGLDSQQVEKLFEAFHTTKPEGLGMGLAISRSIIERHGGHLWAETNQGEPGAIFQFTLPITDGDET